MMRYLLALSLSGVASCGVAEVYSAESGTKFTAKVDWLSDVDVPEVGVITQEGEFYFTKQTEVACAGFRLSGNQLIVDLDDAHGVRWVEGRVEVVRLFVDPGEYKIVVSENLEGDLDSNYSAEFSISVKDDAELVDRRSKSASGTCATGP